MFLDGRPPVNVGVTSGGDIFGGTPITFSDVLGDKQFNFFVASISQYRTIAGLVHEPLAPASTTRSRASRRRDFFYGQLGGVFYDPSLTPFIDRDLAIATRTMQGGSILRHLPVQPLPPRRDVRPASSTSTRSSRTPRCSSISQEYQQQVYGSRSSTTARRCRSAWPTCRRRRSSASSGRCRATRCGWRYEVAPKIGSTLSRQTFDARRAVLPAPRRRQACWRCAHAAFKSMGRRRRLQLLRRQRRAARLRVPAVHRQQRRSTRTPSCASR